SSSSRVLGMSPPILLILYSQIISPKKRNLKIPPHICRTPSRARGTGVPPCGKRVSNLGSGTAMPGLACGMPRSHKAFSLGPLGGHKVHKMVKFRPRGMVDKREMEQAQLFETADERGCTPMFGAAHRRASAAPHPRRFQVCLVL